MVFLALLVLLAAAFAVLAGCKVRGPRFAPEWFALACLIVVFGWPFLSKMGG